MDTNEIRIFSLLHNQILNYDFSETLVIAYLASIRNHVDRNDDSDKPVCEFADFIAHRNRDRGNIRGMLKSVMDYANNLSANQNATKFMEPNMNPVFTLEEIKKSFNNILKRLGYELLSTKMVRVLMLYIMSILQHATFNTNSNGVFQDIGRLHFSFYENGGFILYGIVYDNYNTNIYIPVIVIRWIPNDNIEVASGLIFENGTIFDKCNPERISLEIQKNDKNFVIAALLKTDK